MFFPIFIFVVGASNFKISHLNALLQFKDPNSPKTPHFTISAEGSCVNWTSLNPSVVRVIPNYQTSRCSTSALVEVVATGPKRKATSIIAESPNGATLKCDIFVDSVSNISILTTTRSIYVESSLETLSLQAADSENNIFTSLEGTDIKWTIDNKHIRTISPDDAQLLLHGISPNKSASLIIQGIKVGKTWASAILDGKYKAHVNLVVVEPLALFPSPIVRTLPFHHIPFKLCSTRGIHDNENQKHKCVSPISLPSETYLIETTNHQSMTADQTAYATTHEPGTSIITATDNTISDNTASTFVYVTYPVVEQPEQYIALGDDPVFDPILKDKEGHLLDLFEPVNWEIIGDWSTVGRKEVTLKYHDFKFIAIVHVCPPVYMDPAEAVLPVQHSGFIVMPHGGSGFYEFSVDDQTVLEYSNYRISTFREGTTKIRVQDQKIKKFNAYSEILVSKVAYIDIQVEKRELIAEVFQPKCEVFAIEMKKFSVDVPYRTITTSPDVVSSMMRAQHPGFADIYCEASGTRSQKVKVSAADKLRVNVKGRGSPNSIIPLNVAGGVLQWPDSPPPTIKVSCPDANVTNLHHNTFSIDREYSGFCNAEMQNTKTELNPVPLLVSTQFWLNCSKVDKFVLHVVDEKAAEAEFCNAPPRRLTYKVLSSYRVIPGHLHKLYVFAHDKVGNLINYYSAVPFELRTSRGEFLRPLENHGREGETNFFYTPTTTTDISIISPDLTPSVTSLLEISPLKIQSSQTVYYKKGKNYTFSIEGGSGHFSTPSNEANFSEGRLFTFPKVPGTSVYTINDACSDQAQQYATLNALNVVSLQIIAPSSVAVNTEFTATVKAYGQKSILIPEELLPDAKITLKPDWSTQIKIDTWKMKPTQVGKLVLVATSENGVTATAQVDVIEPIIIKPQYIELLPGDSQRVTIVSGPKDIFFDYGNGNIAKMINLDVIGETPGNITINATAKNIPGLEPFPIYVRVLRPIALRIDPSTRKPIQTGFIGLKLFVETDAGDRVPRKARWSITDSFRHTLLNSSFALLNCSQPKDIHVKVEAFNSLTTTYIANVEPKLILTTPFDIILPPLCSFQIENVGNLRCSYTSADENIVTCENGLVKSSTTEGETEVTVKFGHQTLVVTVRVVKPSFLHVNQISPSDFRLLLLDPHGLVFSTMNGVKMTLDGPEGFATSGIDAGGYCKTQYTSNQVIRLNASASNTEFFLETSINVSVRQRITPERVALVKSASLQFKCTALTPKWNILDKTIATVSNEGYVTSKRPGSTRLSCGPGIDQLLTVVDIVNVQIINKPNDEYEIRPVYSPSLPAVDLYAPPDLTYNCVFDHKECGTVTYKKNQTGHYCVLTRDENIKCPPKTKLKATIYSETAGISLISEAPVAYIGAVDFGVPNQMRFTVSSTRRKVEVPIRPKPSELNINAPRGLNVEFLPEGGIVIRADESFLTQGTVVLEHKETGEIVKIDIVHESSSETESPLFHTRDFKLSQDLIFYASLVTLFASIFFIIVKVTQE